MKNNIAASISISSALLALVLTGCSGQIIASQPEVNTVMETMTAMNKVETTVVTTTLKPLKTTQPRLTSGTTCTTVELNEDVIENKLYSMSLRDKIYQLFIVTPEELTGFNGIATEAGDMTEESIKLRPVGGIIYFSQNIESWQQTYEMLFKLVFLRLLMKKAVLLHVLRTSLDFIIVMIWSIMEKRKRMMRFIIWAVLLELS